MRLLRPIHIQFFSLYVTVHTELTKSREQRVCRNERFACNKNCVGFLAKHKKIRVAQHFASLCFASPRCKQTRT